MRDASVTSARREAGRERSSRRAAAIALCAAFALVVVLASPVPAQAVRFGVVMDGPRATLESRWTEDARQLERAYCVTDWTAAVYHVSKLPPIEDDSIFRIFEIRRAQETGATPVSVDFECPPGVPELHVHTPTTCIGSDASNCMTGGLNAYSCQPSRGDLRKLIRRHDAFGVLQCDKRSFRFYYAAEFIPPTLLADAGGSAPPATAAMSPILMGAAKKAATPKPE